MVSLKKQLNYLLENTKKNNIKRKIKNDLDFLIHQFDFRKISSVKKTSIKKTSVKTKTSVKKTQTGGLKFPRKWSKSYCKRTSCKKMGFSCRPYKNCYK